MELGDGDVCPGTPLMRLPCLDGVGVASATWQQGALFCKYVKTIPKMV